MAAIAHSFDIKALTQETKEYHAILQKRFRISPLDVQPTRDEITQNAHLIQNNLMQLLKRVTQASQKAIISRDVSLLGSCKKLLEMIAADLEIAQLHIQDADAAIAAIDIKQKLSSPDFQSLGPKEKRDQLLSMQKRIETIETQFSKGPGMQMQTQDLFFQEKRQIERFLERV